MQAAEQGFARATFTGDALDLAVEWLLVICGQ
jgi:hypothetical protein